MSARYRFARVRYTDPDTGRRRTVDLRAVTVTDRLVVGTEVANDADGCGWHDVTPPGTDGRTRVIDRTLVATLRPLTEDRRYGTLVPDTDVPA